MAANLTSKQRNFTLGIINGKSGTQAVLEAYNTSNISTAAVIASENLRKPKIINELAGALSKYMLLENALQAIVEALAAEKFSKDG